MYEQKSLIVLCVLLLFILLSAVSISSCCLSYKQKKLKTRKLCCVIILCIFTIALVIGIADYTYPYERFVKFELYAEIELHEENELNPEHPHFWHAAYEQFGLYSSSFYFNSDDPYSHLGFEWPQMDLKHHSYIITYGQKLESLSYNVWETIDYPIRTGAKAGYAVLSEEFDSSKVYVYEIPKIRVENDLNLTTEYIQSKLEVFG